MRFWLLLVAVLLFPADRSAAQQPKGKPIRKTPQRSTVAPDRPASPSVREPKWKTLFDGKSMKEWQVVDRFDFARHGKVRVVEGCIELGAGEPGTAIRWKGELPKDRYELSLEAMRAAGEDFFCGLTFPVGKQHCTLILGGWGGMVVGLSNIDGQSAVENETTQAVPFQVKKWYRVRVRVDDEAIEVWLDKESILRVERKEREFSIWWEQEPLQPLGIATWRTAARVRRIRWRCLDQQTAP